jgi:flagellar motor switch protein FliM
MVDVPESVVADVSGIPVLECKYGTLHGRYALRVDKILAGAHELGEKEAGENDGQ